MTDVMDIFNKLASDLEAEQAEAALLEGVAPISDEAFELLEKYRQVKLQIKTLEETELKPIKDLVLGEMAAKGANRLTRDGVVVVENVVTHRKSVDIPALVRKFPMAVRFIKDSVGTRFDVKKF